MKPVLPVKRTFIAILIESRHWTFTLYRTGLNEEAWSCNDRESSYSYIAGPGMKSAGCISATEEVRYIVGVLSSSAEITQIDPMGDAQSYSGRLQPNTK